jgi:hypothetical protein
MRVTKKEEKQRIEVEDFPIYLLNNDERFVLQLICAAAVKVEIPAAEATSRRDRPPYDNRKETRPRTTGTAKSWTNRSGQKMGTIPRS